jgi:hypothetical protein
VHVPWSKAKCNSAEVVFRRRRQLLCKIADGSGFLTLRFFYFSAQQQAGLARGTRIRCFGEVRRGLLGLEMVHPEYRRIFDDAAALEPTLTPVYPVTEGVSQGRLRMLVRLALAELDTAGVRDWLPSEITAQLALPSSREALRYVHQPPLDAALDELEDGKHPAQRRLAFEELLTHQMAMRRLRESARVDAAAALVDRDALAERFHCCFALSAHGGTATRARRRDARSRPRDADDAPRARRRRVRQDRGRSGGSSSARARQWTPSRVDGADRTSGRATSKKSASLVPTTRDHGGVGERFATGTHPTQRARGGCDRWKHGSSSAPTRSFKRAWPSKISRS